MAKSRDAFAENLKKYVETSGKSRKEIAEYVGVSVSTINDWIRGKIYPRIDNIERLADYFDISKAELIQSEEEEHTEADIRRLYHSLSPEKKKALELYALFLNETQKKEELQKEIGTKEKLLQVSGQMNIEEFL